MPDNQTDKNILRSAHDASNLLERFEVWQTARVCLALLRRTPQREVRLPLDSPRHIQRDHAHRWIALLRPSGLLARGGVCGDAAAGRGRPVEAEPDANDDEHEGDAGRGGYTVEGKGFEQRVGGVRDEEEQRPCAVMRARESETAGNEGGACDIRVERCAFDEYYECFLGGG